MEKFSDGWIENKLEKTTKLVALMFVFPYVERCYTSKNLNTV